MKRVAAVLALLLLGLTAIPVSASSSTTKAEYLIADWINQARNDRGLESLRTVHKLWDVAAYRADRMAETNILSHSIAGRIGPRLDGHRMPWYAYGEDIGYSPQRSVTAAATELFKLWKASPSHWALMMSPRYNYLGVGMDYRASNHRWYASLIFTESPDLTGARTAMLDGYRNGDDVTWTWRGFDPILQTHTAGVHDFDVQMRTGTGSWKTVASGTSSTARTIKDLAGGQWYGMRVRASDKRGNAGPFASEIRIWVP